MRKMRLLGLAVVFAITGMMFYNCTDIAQTGRMNGMIEERFDELHGEYVVSTYGSGTGHRVVSCGESGIGYVNHELGIVFWHVDDVIRAVRGMAFDLF